MKSESADRVLEQLPMVRQLVAAQATGERTVGLVRAGVIALVAASDDWHAEDGVSFEVYATCRVLQAMREADAAAGFACSASGAARHRPEEVGRLSTPFEELPSDEQRVLHQYLVEGRSLGDIARQMGISTDRVRSLRRKAIRRLRAGRKLAVRSYETRWAVL